MIDAKAALVRGLRDFKRYEFNQNGCRWAMERDIPNAIEALVNKKVAEALAAERSKSENDKPTKVEALG